MSKIMQAGSQDRNEESERTYQYQVLLGASFQRLEDAKALLKAERWNGSIYIGCYAIECILKCCLCRIDGNKTNFKETRFYRNFTGKKGHNIAGLFAVVVEQAKLERAITTDRIQGMRKQEIMQLGNHTLYRYNEDEGDVQKAIKVLEEGYYRFFRSWLEKKRNEKGT